MRVMIEIPEIDRVNVNLLRERGVDISAVCREAIVNRVRELDLQRQFIIGDEVRATTGPYQDNFATVVGYWRKMIMVFLLDRQVAMFFPEELKHRDA